MRVWGGTFGKKVALETGAFVENEPWSVEQWDRRRSCDCSLLKACVISCLFGFYVDCAESVGMLGGRFAWDHSKQQKHSMISLTPLKSCKISTQSLKFEAIVWCHTASISCKAFAYDGHAYLTTSTTSFCAVSAFLKIAMFEPWLKWVYGKWLKYLLIVII